MGNEWLPRSLGDILSFANGKTSPERTSGGRFTVFGSNGAIGLSDLKNSPENTIVIGRVGSYCGSTFLSKEECWVTDNAIRANVKRGNDVNFAYYLLQTLNLNERRAGSGQPLLNQSILSTIDVTVPPLDEQRAIAHILGTLDDKIELSRRINDTLEAMARALFKAWFVDFEPVRAKMDGRWQRGQSLPGLPAHLYDLFPDRLVESELGEIPEGWTIKKIRDLITRLSVGKKYEQKTVNEHGKIPVLDQGKNGIIGYHDDEPGVVATLDKPIAVFANHTCLMKLVSFSFSTIQNVLPFVGKTIPTIWIFYASKGKQSFVEYKGHWPDFVIHDIVVPQEDLTSEFVKFAHVNLKVIWKNEIQSRTLSQLRDTLLPKLISGELRVTDAQSFLNEALEPATAP